ncbi:MAG: CDP-diacylglycerol--glycerol-3-phosphate 3-phosphatidyltransferase [Clostridiales bacterium]|nr:CDP-diacylglycerol--glycerol-3-phosphate 3-phosphatidyltransferase [Clostridiales bacterium]
MNLANKITIVRVLLIPLYLVFALTNLPNGQYISAAIFIIATLTDTLDGYIARSRNQITDFGKFMDPLADKLLVMAALIALVDKGRIHAIIPIIILTREFLITGLRSLAASKGVVIAASWWGKLKTVTQMIALILLMIGNFPFRDLNIPMDNIMLYIATVVTIISGYDYIVKNIHVFGKEL